MSRQSYPKSQPGNIPQQLRSYPQWANWHHDKVIRNSRTGRNGSSTDSSTWSTFAQAVKADPDRLVFVFDRMNALVGIDLDHCRDPETGQIAPWAMAIIERFPNIYWEISLSGTGLHGIGRGILPDDASGRHPKGIGIFHHSRYFVMTGHVLPGHETLGDFGPGLADLYREVAPAEPQRPASPPPTLTMDDRDILDRLVNEQNGKARRLLAGDAGEYPSYSDARFGLANKIAFYTDSVDQAARLIRTSGLFKDSDRDSDRDRKANIDARKALSGYTGPRYDPTYRTTPHTEASAVLPGTMPKAEDVDAQSFPAQLMAAHARIAELEATVAARERVIARERDLRKAAEERAERLSLERSKIMEVLRATDLNPGEKLTQFGTVIDLGARIANGEEQAPQGFRLPAIRIAEMTGQKVTSVRRHWNSAAERGILHKTNVRERTDRDNVDPESGEITTATGMRDVTYIHVPENDILNLITPAKTYQKPEGEKRGGRRVKCDKHPEAGTTITLVTTCDECGDVLDRRETHQEPESSGSKFEPETRPVSTTVLRGHFSAPETLRQPSHAKFERQPPLDDDPPDFWPPTGWEDEHRRLYGQLYRGEVAS